MDVVGIGAEFLMLRLAFAQHGPERDRTIKQVSRGQSRLGHSK
jgi:hypothetical protein